MRWGWRLFRREWRQQLLMLGMLTVAVAATIWGASVVTNSQLANPDYATLGTAAASVTLPGADPQLAADIATIQDRWGPADLIENQDIATGATQRVQLRAESPHGLYNAPLLGLVSGAWPAGPGQVALTSQVAARYGAHAGGTWRAAGTSWRVTGIVQDPSNLRALGMLSAIGATERDLRLVMITGGLAVGVAGALAGAAAGLAAWFAYVPALQQAAGHVVDAVNLRWWAFATAVVLAVATSVLASRRPATTIAAVPVVAALSGRPVPPKPAHRSAVPGGIAFAAGIAFLATAGGLAGQAATGAVPRCTCWPAWSP